MKTISIVLLNCTFKKHYHIIGTRQVKLNPLKRVTFLTSSDLLSYKLWHWRLLKMINTFEIFFIEVNLFAETFEMDIQVASREFTSADVVLSFPKASLCCIPLFFWEFCRQCLLQIRVQLAFQIASGVLSIFLLSMFLYQGMNCSFWNNLYIPETLSGFVLNHNLVRAWENIFAPLTCENLRPSILPLISKAPKAFF